MQMLCGRHTYTRTHPLALHLASITPFTIQKYASIYPWLGVNVFTFGWLCMCLAELGDVGHKLLKAGAALLSDGKYHLCVP